MSTIVPSWRGASPSRSANKAKPFQSATKMAAPKHFCSRRYMQKLLDKRSGRPLEAFAKPFWCNERVINPDPDPYPSSLQTGMSEQTSTGSAVRSSCCHTMGSTVFCSLLHSSKCCFMFKREDTNLNHEISKQLFVKGWMLFMMTLSRSWSGRNIALHSKDNKQQAVSRLFGWSLTCASISNMLGLYLFIF